MLTWRVKSPAVNQVMGIWRENKDRDVIMLEQIVSVIRLRGKPLIAFSVTAAFRRMAFVPIEYTRICIVHFVFLSYLR